MDDDLTEQALEYFLENNTLQKKVLEPIKRKVFPYIVGVAFFNVVMFIMVGYLIYLLRLPAPVP
jgi:hypothetical protein